MLRPVTDRSPLPALTERRRLRLAALVALYVGQGIPQGLLVVALPAYLAERGVGAGAVGTYLGLVLLPFALKVVVGPVMDRFTFLPMGRRRPWVLAAGLGVIAAVVAMALVPDAALYVGWLTACGVAINVAVSVLDVAVDGMAVDVLGIEEQPRANALMWGGATVGVAASAVGTAWLLNAGGIGPAAGAVALSLSVLFVVPLLVRERPGERLLPWTAGEAAPESRGLQPHDWRSVLVSLRRAALVPASVLLIGAAWCAGALDGLVIAFMPVLAVGELGWTDTGYASMVAVGQVSAGLLGMVLGSVLIERVGRVRMLVGLAAVVGVVLVTMAAVPDLWTARPVVVTFAVGYLVTFVLLTITLLATGMALCSRAVASTQFALFTAAMNVGRSSGSGVLGTLDAVMGPSALFGVAAVLAGVVLLLASRIDLDAHRARLDAADLGDATEAGGGVSPGRAPRPAAGR